MQKPAQPSAGFCYVVLFAYATIRTSMIPVILFVFGAILGSFANATVWRLHKGRNFTHERSECEFCHHTLSATDLIPIVSWLALRGRCRYCRLRLSMQHPIVELATGLLFAAFYILWPGHVDTTGDWVSLGFWLVYLVGMVMLFIYDLHWQLLPDRIVFPLIGIAVVDVVLSRALYQGGGWFALGHAGVGVAILAGFFGFLYFISKGRWIGFGDVKLGVFMGLVLGMPASLFALLGSYYIAAAVVLPLFLAKIVTRQSKVAFGPFLLISMVASFFLTDFLSNWLQIFL